MQAWKVKILFVFLIMGLAMSSSQAQLLQDINKLKTEKRKGKGYNFFKKLTLKRVKKSKVVGASAARYSQSIAGAGSSKRSNPRFSQVIAGAGGNRKVNPRFSLNPGNFGSYVARKPLTASDRSFVFDYSRVEIYRNRIKNHGEESWNLPKSAKRAKKEGRNFHPSSVYLTAKYKNSKLVRDGLQKFNVLWVRVNGNKTQPKGVYKKSKKLKFDKDEKDIWNNKEREYSHN